MEPMLVKPRTDEQRAAFQRQMQELNRVSTDLSQAFVHAYVVASAKLAIELSRMMRNS